MPRRVKTPFLCGGGSVTRDVVEPRGLANGVARRFQTLLAGLVLSCAAFPLSAAILPEGIESHTRKSVRPIAITADKPVWDEFGLEEAEQAEYVGKTGGFTVAAWRLKDPTSAFGVFEWTRPANGKPATLTDLSLTTPGGAFFAIGNYVLQFDGFVPKADTIVELQLVLPRMDKSALPTLPGFMPAQNRIANSERFILGPATLEKFEPAIAPSLAAFHLGAEGGAARYNGQSGELRLVLFSYPTPHIARDRLAEFQKQSGLIAKRSGPLVAVITSSKNADDAERLLGQVRWQANITVDQRVPNPKENLASILTNIFVLTGILLVLCVAAGLVVAGIRVARSRSYGDTESEDPMIMLHLGDK